MSPIEEAIELDKMCVSEIVAKYESSHNAIAVLKRKLLEACTCLESTEQPPASGTCICMDCGKVIKIAEQSNHLKECPKVETKLIPLTQGKIALVDAKNYEMLSKHKWYANYNQGKWYAQREIKDAEGKRITLRMHRVIMNCPDDKQIDHINHNGLDDRELNLRICTNAENQHNQKPRKGGSSKYKGVSLRKDTKQWTAHIKNGGGLINLGHYDTEIEAAKAYDDKAKELFGEFACLNLTGESEFTKKFRISLDAQDRTVVVQDAYDLCARLDRSESSRKALLTACEKVQKWLDTSSLQQVLVHYTEDERRHALIMGIASNLERLEAAIAKEKEVRE